MQNVSFGRNHKIAPFNQKDSIYSPYKGYMVFYRGDTFYRLKCERVLGKKQSYTINGKDGKEWVRHTVEELTYLLNYRGISNFDYEAVNFKMELVNTAIVVSQEYKDDFVAVRAKGCKDTSLAYRIYPRDLVRKYPLLAEFEKTRYSTRSSLFRSLRYYLALSLGSGR